MSKEILYNYSSLTKRDTKLYNIGGTQIAGGLSISFAKVVVPVAIFFLLLGTTFSFLFNVNMYDFFKPNWSIHYLLFWLVVGIGSGLGFWYINIGGYRLYEYLLAYIRPKKVYTNNLDFRFREFKLNNITINPIVKNIL